MRAGGYHLRPSFMLLNFRELAFHELRSTGVGYAVYGKQAEEACPATSGMTRASRCPHP
jgi:hypothetical protein